MKKYLIGGIVFAFSGNWFEFPDEIERFRNDGAGDGFHIGVSYIRPGEGNGKVYLHERTGEPLMRVTEDGRDVSVELNPDYPECYGLRTLLDIIDLPSRLIGAGGIIFHSSYVCRNNAGILFTGAKQAGKSTQADLWRKYRRAVIVNGDRTVLKKQGKSWTAHGSPYSGTSGISLNVSCPVRCIVTVRKSAVNRCEKAGPSGAFKALLEGCTYNTADADEMTKAIGIMTDIAEKVDFYELFCRPDEGSVDALERVLND